MSEWENSPEGAKENAGGRVVALLLLGLALVLGGLYAAAHYAAADKVPRGTTVSGVAIGGQPQDQAAERLREGLAERVSEPIRARIDGTSLRIDPEEAGLSVDHEASVAEAGGEWSWSPARLWTYFTGGDDLEAVVEVDEERYGELLARLDEVHATAPREGAVRFRGAQVRTRTPRLGTEVDPNTTREALVEAFLTDSEPALLTLVDREPEIDAGDVDQAVDTFANPAVSAPVELSFGGSTVTLHPRDYTAALSLEPVNGELVPTLDEKRLAGLVEGLVAEDGAPVDATVRLVDGKPRVIPAKPGVTYDQKQVDDAFLDLVTRPEGKRTLELDAKVAAPDFTTKEAKQLRIKERVSTFTTYYPHADYRNVNLGRAAELINGTVLEPGETFSLNDIVGERTRANGFTEGFIIADGVFKEDLGGGVSQMATTLFNAMFFAGLEDVEHRPHSFYIDRYPVGREATVVWGALDLQFKNDTPYGVLVQAFVTPSTPSSSGSVTVSMWSTDYWDITTTTSERYNLTEPETRTLRTEDCYPNEGYGGFDIDVTRYFRRAGQSELHHKEVFHTTYTPSDTVICKPPKDD